MKYMSTKIRSIETAPGTGYMAFRPMTWREAQQKYVKHIEVFGALKKHLETSNSVSKHGPFTTGMPSVSRATWFLAF